ncbi:hypothetical protein V6N13_149611 [Hibiscus sabdariffa]|uniref:Uncharacterized protein n=2 Tax=Hibiscus sabdariffa TaxID=183260 RepID=A0ABR2EGV5_9ROSI
MEKILVLAWILVLSSAMAMAPCHGYYSDSKPYVPAPQKVTRLNFFLHDTLSGKDPSAVTVARPNVTTTSVPFGEVIVVDDPLIVDPDITSGVIKNAQGLWVLTDKDVLTLMVYLDFGFTKGEFNDSSIKESSRWPKDLRSLRLTSEIVRSATPLLSIK